MASKCTKCGDTESYNFALNIGLCNPCIGKRLEKLEADLANYFEMAAKSYTACGNYQQRIRELEAALQGMVLFIEEDFPNGTGTNHGTCATDQYQQACDAVIQILKG